MKRFMMSAVLFIAAIIIVTAAVWWKRYYYNRYVGADYYAVVPHWYDVTPEMRYTMSGAEAGLGKTYKLTAFNEHGAAKDVEINVYESRHTFPRPGEFLYISASRQLVVKWNVTDEKNVPGNILEVIRMNN